jgi:hypothetical protein
MEANYRTKLNDSNLDALSYLLQMEKATPRLGDYLNSGPVEGWMRDKLMQFILQICKEIGGGVETCQQAITVIDHFLSKSKPRKAVLQLIGVAGLMASLRFNETIVYTLEDAFLHCGKTFKKEDIRLAEIYAIEKLGWLFQAPTASELAKQLLIAAKIEVDTSSILERADFYAIECYTNYSLCQFSTVAKTVVSILCALEESGQISYRNKLINFLYTTFDLDFIEIEICKRSLIDHLRKKFTCNEDRSYTCLSKGGILTYISQAISDQAG